MLSLTFPKFTLVHGAAMNFVLGDVLGGPLRGEEKKAMLHEVLSRMLITPA